MDRVQRHSWDLGRQPQVRDSLPVVFSRRQVLRRMQAAVGNGEPGPVLLTGEPGSGKTWLARRFASQLPAGWRAVRVDLGAAMNALEFLRLIGHSLGVSAGNRLGAARLKCEAALDDEAAEGRRWLLVIDDAHRGSPCVWDEIQAIVSRQGQPGGFGGVFILGRTALARAISTASCGGLAPGLLAHLHLPPLDLDEARELLGGEDAGDEQALEELHRDAQGNAGMLLRLAQTFPEHWQLGPAPALDNGALRPSVEALERSPSARLLRPDAPEKPGEPVAPVPAGESLAVPARSVGPALIPTKPPLRIEDGLVEVGWDGDLASELDLTDDEEARFEPSSDLERSYHEEPIEDHYAALQARAEEMRNQSRLAGLSEDTAKALAPGGHDLAEELEEQTGEQPRAHKSAETALPASGIRVEGQHEFAPYSQLFTRLRQSKQ